MARKKDEALPGTGGRTKGDIRVIINEGHQKIGRIFRASEKIDNRETATLLRDLCIAARRIYDDIDKYPHDIKQARDFLNYYMDTTVKIVVKYVELSDHRDLVPDVDRALLQVEGLIRTIKESFDRQLGRLFEDDLFDLEVEIQVLEKALKMDNNL